MAKPGARGWKLHWWLPQLPKWAKRRFDTIIRDSDPESLVNTLEGQLALQIRTTGIDGGPAASTRGMLADALERSGRYAEARLLREEVLASMRRNLGNEEPRTLDGELWLAVNLVNDGLRADARPLFTHVWETRLRTLGPTHEDTLKAGRFLATTNSEFE